MFEIGDFLGRGRQTDQVERDAADQGPLVRQPHGPQPGRAAPGRDEPIDRPLGLAARVGRRLDGLDPLKRPVARCERALPRAAVLTSASARRPLRRPTGRTPSATSAGKWPLGRHLQLVVGLADRPDEQALFGLAGDDRRAAVAALARATRASRPSGRSRSSCRRGRASNRWPGPGRIFGLEERFARLVGTG